MEVNEERRYFERILEKQAEVLGEVNQMRGLVYQLDSRIKVLEKTTERVEDDLEQSGQHELVKLQKERDELKEARRHWVRYVVTVIVSLVTGAVLLSLGRMLK